MILVPAPSACMTVQNYHPRRAGQELPYRTTLGKDPCLILNGAVYILPEAETPRWLYRSEDKAYFNLIIVQ